MSNYRPEEFRIRVPEIKIADLQARLEKTKWPQEPEGAAWQFGANLGYMKRLVEYWRTGYNWRTWEAKLNSWPQFRVAIPLEDGTSQTVHYLIEKGSGENPPALVITHGWPSSVFEFYKVIDRLAHPERFGGDERDAFTVICPTLPGYPYSQPLAKPFNHRKVAALWRKLVVDVLGYKSFFAQAGDWGSVVTGWLGVDHADVVKAIHLNMVPFRPALGAGLPPLSDDEKKFMAEARARMAAEGGYFAIQSTKPSTLAYGLADSPTGLAAWIGEKYHGWSSAPAEQDPLFTMDEILTEISLYWFSGAISSSLWMYWAATHEGMLALKPGQSVGVPTAFQLPPWDLIPIPPKSWLERCFNLKQFTCMKEGGHFVALERPEDLAADASTFFRPYR